MGKSSQEKNDTAKNEGKVKCNEHHDSKEKQLNEDHVDSKGKDKHDDNHDSKGKNDQNGDDCKSSSHGITSINGGSCDDSLNGGNGKDQINGSNGNDTLHGGNGKDTLDGGNGDDHLTGGHGNDILKGGDGNDHYYFSKGDGHDFIIDSSGQDLAHFDGYYQCNAQYSVIDTDCDGNIDALKLTLGCDLSVTVMNYFNDTCENVATSGAGFGVVGFEFEDGILGFDQIHALLA